jgi:uncharacterized protein YjbJ (UPF0337 family)
MSDDIKHGVEKALGKVKEGVGRATGDRSLERQGDRDQAKADLGKAVDKAKDAVRGDR